MAKQGVWYGFLAGLLAGVVGVFAISGGLSLRSAVAQAPAAKPAPVEPPQRLWEVGRYRMACWSYPTSGTATVTDRASHGVYVLDTQTGDVWQSEEDGALEPVQRAKAPKGR